ncbi:hypothetical protein SAMN06265368_2557 [Cohaesibacter gelatinilyticus]|uniref:Uncharacterized protein n=1 Tax=Cohaesibacter gelatinilyticus TaxID=372072 RepID=A0A285PCN2_9HYPH|nr:hypothetical protein SAMN06265368_2557 [Cohaesibacter gelatinilyticus]
MKMCVALVIHAVNTEYTHVPSHERIAAFDKRLQRADCERKTSLGRFSPKIAFLLAGDEQGAHRTISPSTGPLLHHRL